MRVLQIVGAMNAGGIETFVMSIYRNIDRSKVQFDFLCSYGDKYFYEDEINSLGGRVYRVRWGRKHPIASRKRLEEFYRSHSYDVIHFHAGSLKDATPLYVSRRFGIKETIIHAHSAFPKMPGFSGKLNKCLHEYNAKKLVPGVSTCYACSGDAARWFEFDKYNKPWKFIRNGIDIPRFTYSGQKREEKRRELGIDEDEFLLGTVGRLAPVKNQEFLIRIFARLIQKRPRSKLLIVGDGPCKSRLKQLCSELGCNEKVLFLQNRTDIDALQCAMDSFALPSLNEGLSIAFVEAQASGVPCFASSEIPSDNFILDASNALPIDQGEMPWVEALLREPVGKRIDSASHTIEVAGFNIKKTAKILYNHYMEFR